MEKDLKSMSRKELEKLLSDVKKALQAAQARERRAARKAAQKAAAEYGFSLNELADEAPAPKKAKKPRKAPAGPKSKPQFANPENPSQNSIVTARTAPSGSLRHTPCPTAALVKPALRGQNAPNIRRQK